MPRRCAPRNDKRWLLTVSLRGAQRCGNLVQELPAVHLYRLRQKASEPAEILSSFKQIYAKEALNKSVAALSGSFAATYRFENLEIHKVFLRFSNLNLRKISR
ncbi:MAG: hypothetical protein ACI3VU_07830 [Faecousia sp.]